MNMPKQYVPFAIAGVTGLAGFFLGDWGLLAWLLAAAIAAGGVVLNDTRRGVLAASALGLGCSAYLFTLKLEASGQPAACDLNEVFSCGSVNASSASEILGIPIALLGVGFFLGVGLAAALARDVSSKFFPTLTVLSSIGILYCVYLAWVALGLGSVCVMCITIYLCTGLLLWAGLKGLAEEGTVLADVVTDIPTSAAFFVVAGTLVATVLLGMASCDTDGDDGVALPRITGEAPPSGAEAPAAATSGTQPRSEDDNTDDELREQLAKLFTDAPGPISLAGTEPVLGDPEAPFVVLEFADFGCPHCAQASVQLKQLVQQMPDIQVRFRPFPLSGACNPVVESKDRVDRCRAAVAAECANEQGKFWEYSAEVFSSYDDLSDGALARAATRATINETAWMGCMQRREILQRVVDSAQAGVKAGVMGTPAMFLKGLDGDRWVEVCAGPEAILALVQMHKNGISIPQPASRTCF